MSQSLINPYFFGVPIPPPVGGQGVWVEVGRTTLVAPGDSVTVANLPNKEFYMILVDIPASADVTMALRIGATGSPDGGANYAYRTALNGVMPDTEFPNVNQIELSPNEVNAFERFGFGYISNLQNHEKLVTFRAMHNEDGVAANYFRTQVGGKWSATDPLDTISLVNTGSGDFAIGSELVVLGWSRFDDETQPNFWQFLGEGIQTNPTGTAFSTPNFPKKKYLMINNQLFYVGSGAFAWQGQFGDGAVDTSGNNYQNKIANGSFPDSGSFPDNSYQASTSGNSNNYSTFMVLNAVGREKILIGQGNGNDPTNVAPADITRNQVEVKSNDPTIKTGQIDIVRLHQYSGTGFAVVGSKVTVWGND